MFYEMDRNEVQMLPITQTGLTGLMAIGELTADESLKTMKELELGLSEELFEECCASGDSL